MTRHLVVVALLAASCTPAHAARRALVIGIDDYVVQDPKQARFQKVSWRNLEGAVNDATAMTAVLESRGFKVVVVPSKDATREKILASIRKVLIDPTRPGDVGVLFVSSHGSLMTNSLSDEPDRLDETIVAHPDPKRPRERPDIRDKELAHLLVEAADRGLLLTVILDNCHSGGLARGLGDAVPRSVPPEPDFDVKDGSPPASPRDHGVLIVAAAQDTQLAVESRDDQGIVHGVFTTALLRALREAPPTETAEDLVTRTKGILQQNLSAQEPQLVANDRRRLAPLFGEATAAGGRKLAVAVVRRRGDDLVLQGGRAVGIAVGAELVRRPATRTSTLPPLRVKVESVEGVAQSVARVVTKDGAAAERAALLATVAPGQLFEVDKWAAPDQDALKIHVGRQEGDAAALLRVAKALEGLRTSPAVTWVDDPSELEPSHVVGADEAGWWLRGPDNVRRDLGKEPSAERVLEAIALSTPVLTAAAAPAKDGCAPRACLFVRMPAPAALTGRIRVGSAEADVIRRVEERDAQYVLGGRLRDGALEYAWLRRSPGTKAGTRPAPTQMPGSTAWIRLPADVAPDGEASTLDELAKRLAVVRGWLVLPMPENPGNFPYKLVLQNHATGEPKHQGDTVQRGEVYDFVLEADPAVLSAMPVVDQRYVYVIGVDSEGKVVPYYAPDENALVSTVPVRPGGDPKAPIPARFPVSSYHAVKITSAVETVILITSGEPVPGIRAIGQAGVKGGGGTGLERFLLDSGAVRRGEAVITAPNWSIQRVQVFSAPKAN